MISAWETAARYHLIHAVGLFCIALWLRQKTGQRSWPLRWAAGSWTTGIVLFSGSLYGLALGGPRWLGPVTPLGGVAFIAGWILLIVGVLAIVLALVMNQQRSRTTHVEERRYDDGRR